jgi:hypothetical protein
MNKTEQERLGEYCAGQIRAFKELNGYWPRTQEIPALARRIQRNFGKISDFRKKYNLGYEDYTKGDYRSDVARAATLKSSTDEEDLYKFLISKYGEVNVHRNPSLYSNTKHTGDFFIYKSGVPAFMIDVFYPNSLCSFKGCINIKKKKYDSYDRCPVIFVQLNPNIKEEDMDDVLNKKKIKLNPNIRVMSITKFKSVV